MHLRESFTEPKASIGITGFFGVKAVVETDFPELLRETPFMFKLYDVRFDLQRAYFISESFKIRKRNLS